MNNTIIGNKLYVMQIITPTAQGSALRTLRNKKTGCYNLPTDGYTINYTFPMPSIDGYSGSYVTNIDSGNNANGDMEGVIISSKVNISGFSWLGLDTTTGRALLKMFMGGENLMFFARYYDIALGEFVIRQFCRGDIEYEMNNVITTVTNGVTSLDVDYWKSISVPVKEV